MSDCLETKRQKGTEDGEVISRFSLAWHFSYTVTPWSSVRYNCNDYTQQCDQKQPYFPFLFHYLIPNVPISLFCSVPFLLLPFSTLNRNFCLYSLMKRRGNWELFWVAIKWISEAFKKTHRSGMEPKRMTLQNNMPDELSTAPSHFSKRNSVMLQWSIKRLSRYVRYYEVIRCMYVSEEAPCICTAVYLYEC